MHNPPTSMLLSHSTQRTESSNNQYWIRSCRQFCTKEFKWKDREGRGDAIEMHRYRALPPGGLQRVPMVMAKAHRPATGWYLSQREFAAVVASGWRKKIYTLEKAEHFCVKTHKHILSHFHFPFSQTMHYLWGMSFFSSSCRLWSCRRGRLWVAFITVSVPLW